MKTLNTIIRELFGLFIDDSSLALALLVLLGVVAFLVHETGIDTSHAAVLLVAGSIAVLIENVVRSGGRGQA
jgi:hypothetical protein